MSTIQNAIQSCAPDASKQKEQYTFLLRACLTRAIWLTTVSGNDSPSKTFTLILDPSAGFMGLQVRKIPQYIF